MLINTQNEYLGATLCKSLAFCHCTALPCLVLCPANSSCLGFPRCRHNSERLCTSSYAPLCVLQSGNFLKEINRGNTKDHLIRFLSIRDYWLWLPNVPYLDCCHFIVQFFSCFLWESKSNPYYSISIGNGSPPIQSLLSYLIIYKAANVKAQ